MAKRQEWTAVATQSIFSPDVQPAQMVRPVSPMGNVNPVGAAMALVTTVVIARIVPMAINAIGANANNPPSSQKKS